jgi:hypothetical protein
MYQRGIEFMRSHPMKKFDRYFSVVNPGRFLQVLILAFSLQFTIESVSAAENQGGSAEFQSLDRKIQDTKQEVLELNRDLFILEEELLFPASTQVAVFLSVDVGEFFQLDSVQLKLDNKVVSNYLYTERESAALLRGGVHRLHMGNLRTGKHELVAVFTGKGPHERDYRRATTLEFEKTTDPKTIELQIRDIEKKLQPDFQVKESK